MTLAEFQAVLDRNWQPAELVGDNIPSFLKRIPDTVRYKIYASGGPYEGITNTGGAAIPSGELIGGIDVYRYGIGDPVRFNKDWYPVLSLDNGGTLLLVYGPLKDNEHWIDEIPERLGGVTVLGIPPKNP
jgi:hypothetical protein